MLTITNAARYQSHCTLQPCATWRLVARRRCKPCCAIFTRQSLRRFHFLKRFCWSRSSATHSLWRWYRPTQRCRNLKGFHTVPSQVINEVVWLHLICCSPIPAVCLVCPSDAPQGFVWQSSLKSIHTHCLETLHLCIANSTPHHVQHHPLRSVYFAPDLSLHKDDMEPHNRSQTDVWANVNHVLRQLWGQLWDYRCTLAPASVARDAFIDQQLRKFVPPSLRASALVLCQRLPEAARILDEGDLSLDACVLSCIFDAAGLCPRFERKDGPCIGVAGYMIKAFLAPIAPPGQALLPTGHDSSMELCCYLALSLDSSHHVAPNLQLVQPGSCVSIQLLAFIFVHLFRSRQTGAVFSFPLERAVKLKLGLDQPIELSGGCKYLEAMCNYVAKHFEENSKGDALHLVEAARM